MQVAKFGYWFLGNNHVDFGEKKIKQIIMTVQFHVHIYTYSYSTFLISELISTIWFCILYFHSAIQRRIGNRKWSTYFKISSISSMIYVGDVGPVPCTVNRGVKKTQHFIVYTSWYVSRCHDAYFLLSAMIKGYLWIQYVKPYSSMLHHSLNHKIGTWKLLPTDIAHFINRWLNNKHKIHRMIMTTGDIATRLK